MAHHVDLGWARKRPTSSRFGAVLAKRRRFFAIRTTGERSLVYYKDDAKNRERAWEAEPPAPRWTFSAYLPPPSPTSRRRRHLHRVRVRGPPRRQNHDIFSCIWCIDRCGKITRLDAAAVSRRDIDLWETLLAKHSGPDTADTVPAGGPPRSQDRIRDRTSAEDIRDPGAFEGAVADAGADMLDTVEQVETGAEAAALVGLVQVDTRTDLTTGEHVTTTTAGRELAGHALGEKAQALLDGAVELGKGVGEVLPTVKVVLGTIKQIYEYRRDCRVLSADLHAFAEFARCLEDATVRMLAQKIVAPETLRRLERVRDELEPVLPSPRRSPTAAP